MPADLQDIEKNLKPKLTKLLDNLDLVSVLVEEDRDHDGDQILRIRVTFTANDEKPDPLKVKGLIRHIGTALADLDDDRFPIVSFNTTDDVEGRSPEAA